MYPESEIEMGSLGAIICKFGLLNIWSTTFGLKMQPRGIRCGKILANISFKKHSVCPQALYNLISDIQLKWAMGISHITLLARNGIYYTGSPQLYTAIP